MRSRYRRDTSRASSTDTPRLLGGLLLVVGAGYAFKKLVLDAAPAGAAPAKPAAPPAPAAPGPLPNLPGVLPLAMSVGVGDTVLVGVSALPPVAAAFGDVTAVEVRITKASPGSPTVSGVFTDSQLSTVPEFPFPRSAIIGVSKSTPIPQSPTPGSPGGPPMGTPLYLDDPLALRMGVKYRARLALGPLEAMLASKSAIEGQFSALGFTGATAYEPANTPVGWPAATKQGDLARTWFIEGTWGQPNQSVAKPPQVVMAWEA